MIYYRIERGTYIWGSEAATQGMRMIYYRIERETLDEARKAAEEYRMIYYRIESFLTTLSLIPLTMT